MTVTKWSLQNDRDKMTPFDPLLPIIYGRYFERIHLLYFMTVKNKSPENGR